MLYLFRNERESVKMTLNVKDMIAAGVDEIDINVINLSVKGKIVKLGFIAPQCVKINRDNNIVTIADGQQLTLEQQERETLKRIKHG
jgi:sRNA-binding carbon storage regulator CsrA